MHTASAMRSLFPLAFALPLASAHPVEPRDAPQFVITDLGATFPYPNSPYGVPSVDSVLTISVTYPDPSSPTESTLSTTCSLNWPKGTDPAPTAWTPCVDPALQLRLPTDGWTRTTNFTVELWETLTPSGTGLVASQLLTSDLGNPSDPNAYMFCIQKGKFNPLTCTLTGPTGQIQRQVVMPAVGENSRPA
ncbi:hypothetical protein F5B18DRAFT_634295 [Nemania serpens]|nr:hypothetical protein F5B18DRAFT_634295 [Nemania serpens]